MNLQPSLIGELVELRPLSPADYSPLLKAASDPLIWEQHPQSDRHKPEVFENFFAEAMKSKGAFAITDRGTGEIIGSSRFYDYSGENSSVKIGYTFLTRKYWGGTVNRDLKKLMVNYAMKHVKTAYFEVGVKNIRSQKAMEKIGAINTGLQYIEVSYSPPKPSYVFKLETPL